MIIGQVRKRYTEFKFSWKFATKLFCFIVFLFCLYVLVNHFKSAKYFPIKQVSVAGVQHVNSQEMQRLLKPLVDKDFFAVNLVFIKEQLLQQPWIASASVRRVWPNHIVIQIAEKIPFARWNDTSLLSSSGELFRPAVETYPTDLPKFVGPEGKQIYMLESYSKISGLLAPLHFRITRLELSPSQSWNITFANGVKLQVGHKDILTRLSHFVKVYPKIVGNRVAEIDSIDLRYSNGLAVRWKTTT